MRIAVIGLGLIGASIARALKMNTTYRVDGWNRNPAVSDFALAHGYIDGLADDLTSYDVVFVALPPQATVDYINAHSFAPGAIVADICGVKGFLAEEMEKKPRSFRYVGTHPMAGKETSGIESSTDTLFKGANIVLVEGEDTDRDALQTVEKLYFDMGAGHVIRCSSAEHDRQIAYTSQLAHIVSNAYIRSDTSENCLRFTGGSFQDMTRVASVDEKIWTELFFENKACLQTELDGLIARLQEYSDALKAEDAEEMKSLLIKGKEKHSICRRRKK